MTSLEIKSELVQVRNILNTASDNAADALFSLDLEGIVDLMDPNRSRFTVMELLEYKLERFPATSESSGARLLGLITSSATTDYHSAGEEIINLDTSVPDASQPTTRAALFNVEERWLASATSLTRASYGEGALFYATEGAGFSYSRGFDFSKQWVNLMDEKGRGKIIAAPRLIVRYMTFMQGAGLQTTALDQTFQFRARYRTKTMSKNEMWKLLLQQTPGETLIRSGSAAFP